MERYAIKHKPTGKFLYEDEGGSFLVDKDDAFVSFGRKSDADKLYDDMVKYCTTIFTDDDEFPVEEFEVAKL